ncbi:MAG: type II toxin-antitoxin system VapC family toxin [Candidatus Omnitrophota bacterium]|jgi:predicted nucleic-acid-binding protein|nr:MAG: type II toxin-antitoxin system VapC family toxin [Candidatus Omnitrophota bacterium]
MAKQQLLDTNILIRFFTGAPSDQAQKVYSLIAEADSGKMTLVVLPMIVAETVYTLQSFYKMNPKDIASKLILFIQSRGIQTEEKNRLLDTLKRYGSQRSSFVDAYQAACSFSTNIPIASFDRDFNKFKDISRIEPKGDCDEL